MAPVTPTALLETLGIDPRQARSFAERMITLARLVGPPEIRATKLRTF
jgi:hypothetical protein